MSVCGPAPSVTTEAGFALQVPHGLDAVRDAHTVIAAPAGLPGRYVPPEVLTALRAADAAGKRVASLCTGAFMLAAAGLLDGHAATTHWSECAALARGYPRVRVDEKALYVHDGNLLTSAGSAASLDLCLYMLQQDYGTEIATKMARDLVLPLHRPGGQAQYIEEPLPPPAEADRLGDTLTWLREHLAEPVTVCDLARRAAMSERTFARRFTAGTGTTPLRWIVTERVRLAQRLLETTSLPVDAIAARAASALPTTCASTSRGRCAPPRRPTAALSRARRPAMTS